MGNLNKVTLIGRLGQDPEIKYVGKNETPVVNISLATSEKYKAKSGEMIENTEWHKLTFWNRTAEILDEYCQSGSQIYIEGKLKTEQWEDDDENTHYTTKIIVSMLQLLDPPAGEKKPSTRKKAGSGKPKSTKSNRPKKAARKDDDYEEDDIPF